MHHRAVVSRTLYVLASLTTLTAAGCLGVDGADDQGTSVEAVLGAARFDGSCSNDQENVIVEAERFGRRVTNTTAFQQCISNAVTGFTFTYPDGATRKIGPYYRCDGDPGAASDTPLMTTANVIVVARSPNDFMQGCTPTLNGDTVAATTLDYGLGHHNDEGFQWVGPLVADVATALTRPVCAAGTYPPSCRYAYPWPWANMAATAWHEAAHTHGYKHGTGTVASCRATPVPGPTFEMKENTMPYIIQACIEAVAADSTRAAAGGPSLANGCPRGQLAIAPSIGASGAVCADDPRLSPLSFTQGTRSTASAFGLFSVDRLSGNVMRRVGAGWSTVGGAGRSFAAADDALYAISADGAHVVRYDGATWTSIGGASQGLVVGGRRVFSIAPGTGDIYRYDNSPNAWTRVGGPGAQFVVASDGRLYGLTSNRQSVVRLDEGGFGSFGWTVVGGAASQIFTAGAELHAVRPDNLAVLKLGASGWTTVVSSSTTLQGRFLGAAGGRVYSLFGQRLVQYRGLSGRTVETLAEDVDNVTTTGATVYLDRARGPHSLLRP